MREKILLNENWFFTGRDGKTVPCNIPHTWNAIDGQDGGNDYYRGECIYTKSFEKPEFDSEALKTLTEEEVLRKASIEQ